MLKERQVQILSYLLERNTYVTIGEMADAFQISARTVRNDLDAISYELSSQRATMERKPKVGIRILAEDGFDLEELLKSPGIKDESQNERAWKILLYLALQGQSTVDELADTLFVSRNTSVSDLKRAEQFAQEEGVRLVGTSYVGTKLSGNETDIRRLLYNTHIEWLRHSENGILDFAYGLSFITKEEIADLLGYMEQSMSVRFSDQSVKELQGGLLVALHRMRMGECAEALTGETEPKGNVYHALMKYFRVTEDSTPNPADISYLCLLFQSARYVSGESAGENRSGDIASLCRKMLTDFADIVKIPVDMEGELEEKFLVHLQISVTRLAHNIRIENALLSDMRYSASFMYDIAKELLKRYESRFGVVFPEEETAFVAMYFEVLFQQNIKVQDELRIVIVCHGGIATSSLLKQRLSVIVPQLQVYAVLRVGNLEQELPQIAPDIIITTLSLKLSGYRVIKVNPILNPEDVQKITAAVSELTYKKQNDFLLERVDWGSVHSLRLLLQPEMCQFGIEEKDWKKAIRKASAPLLSAGRIEEAYVSEMIRVVQELGNYMVFIPEIAFVHAKPTYVRQTGIAVCHLKHAIDFGSRTVTKVKVIVVVANREENTMLAELIKLLLVGDNVEAFKAAESYDDLQKLDGE